MKLNESLQFLNFFSKCTGKQTKLKLRLVFSKCIFGNQFVDFFLQVKTCKVFRLTENDSSQLPYRKFQHFVSRTHQVFPGLTIHFFIICCSQFFQLREKVINSGIWQKFLTEERKKFTTNDSKELNIFFNFKDSR